MLGGRPAGRHRRRPAALDWLVLLAKDEAGYANLCKLVSSAHLDRPLSEEPHVALAALDGAQRRADRADRRRGRRARAAARRRAGGQGRAPICDRLQALFPDRLYIELSRRGDPVEEAAEAALIDLAYAARPAAGRDQPRRLRRARASTPRTTPCCASPIRPMSKAPSGRPRRPKPGSRTARRWPSCSPTCPKRSPTPR